MTLGEKAASFKREFYKANRVLALFASVSLAILLLYSTADVIGRYVFNRPMFGTWELTQSFLVLIVFLGIAYVQSRKMHIRLEILAYKVSPRMWAVLDLLTYLTGLIMFVFIIWQGSGWAWRSFTTGEIMQGRYPIPLWPSQFVLLFGSAVFCIQYAIDIIEAIGRIRKPKTEPKPVK